MRLPVCSLILAALTVASAAEVAPPKVLVPDLQLELLAAEPELVTPVGAAADARGRIFVVESHTHFPKADYPGPKSDRVLVFSGQPGARPTVFAEGFRWAMNLAFAPDGVLFLTHRNGVVRLMDQDADGRADTPQPLLRLETKGDYPHNGIGGLAFGPDGGLYVGIGENLGLEYTVRGSDNSVIHAPAGAGGLILRCQPDGSKLELWATGFWNAFALEFDAQGRLFMVDNDPDSRPPCRLVQVIRDGYYGFQFRHGRNGLNPFTAWDGELPGSLPMVAGTGEAPSAVLDARRTRFPAPFAGSLLVTATWDHSLERFRPAPVGASLRAQREVIVQGDADFRPVALAAAPDGSVVITDWVKSDYSVHRHGRLWRLAARQPAAAAPASLPPLGPAESRLREVQSLPASAHNPALIAAALSAGDPFLHAAAVAHLATHPLASITNTLRSPHPGVRVGAVLALRRALGLQGYPRAGGPAVAAAGPLPDAARATLRLALADAAAEVRLAAVVWIGEDRLAGFRPELAQVLTAGPVTPELLSAHAEAQRVLAQAAAPDGAAVAAVPKEVRSFNLAPLDTNRFARAIVTLREPQNDAHLRLEAIRDLAGTHETNAVAVFQAIARDPAQPPPHRAEAILALTGSHEDHVSELAPLLGDSPVVVQGELARALQPWLGKVGVKPALEALAGRASDARLREQLRLTLGQALARPNSDDAWRHALAAGSGDAGFGRRVFFSPQASCGKCHRVEGRGGLVGPDLSTIARAADREKLLQSLLHPSRDIAPQFALHLVETKDGETYSGRLFGEDAQGTLTLLNGEGSTYVIPKSLIRDNQPSSTSLMPDGLVDGMTLQDLRDLLAYLESRR